MFEIPPEPNLILPIDPANIESVRRAFQVFEIVCETLSAASQLIDLMPGNDRWVLSR